MKVTTRIRPIDVAVVVGAICTLSIAVTINAIALRERMRESVVRANMRSVQACVEAFRVQNDQVYALESGQKLANGRTIADLLPKGLTNPYGGPFTLDWSNKKGTLPSTRGAVIVNAWREWDGRVRYQILGAARGGELCPAGGGRFVRRAPPPLCAILPSDYTAVHYRFAPSHAHGGLAISDTPDRPGEEFHLMTTQTLVEHAAGGNARATEALFERLRPRLVRWARGRLPGHARDLHDTEDLVHEVMLSSLSHLQGFEQKRGGFISYLCTGVMNRALNDIRRVENRPGRAEINDTIPARDPSQLEALVGRDEVARYRRALDRLSPIDQDLVIGRLEMEMSFADLALHVGKPSTDAARMAFERAVERLAKILADDGPRT